MALRDIQEGEGRVEVGPELNHYFEVVGTATDGMLRSLFAGLGPDVLPAEERAAFATPAPASVNVAPNNVINFPQQPGLGEVATDAMTQPYQVSPPAPLGNIAPVQPFPQIEQSFQPPFQDAA
jgi:hypothetical protein